MNKPLKLIPIGNSTGVILPRELLTRLRVTQGDALFLSEAPDGSYRLTPSNPDFERQMAAAEEIMKSDRDILRVLSK
jgi:putative addiction module antidote